MPIEDVPSCEYNVQSDPQEQIMLECQTKDYIDLYGHTCDLYIMTKYDPENVWGEDPLKEYALPAIPIKCIWDQPPETQSFGSHGKISDEDEIIMYAHISTSRELIKDQLVENGYIVDDSTIFSLEDRTKQERHRIDIQEGDIIRTIYNNIHYEISGIKTAPSYQHLNYKFFYEIHARPRLVSSEGLGYIQPVTDNDEIINKHEEEIDTESNKILF